MTGLEDVTFTEVILSLDNEGDAVAARHRPEITIKFDGDIVFDNRQKLRETGLSGQVPPKHHVGFRLCELLKEHSDLSTGFKLEGIFFVVGKTFEIVTRSIYTDVDGQNEYRTGKYKFRVKWYTENGEWGPIRAKISDNVLIDETG